MPTTPDVTGTGLDRRALIKRAAAVGAAAWTAPAIIGSLASPAGALTIQAGCYRMLFIANGSSCSNGPTVASAGCTLAGSACSNPATTIPADVAACVTVTNPSPCNTGNTNASVAITFSVSGSCTTCTIVAAAGRRTSAIGAQCNVTEAIAGGGKSVIFDGDGLRPDLAEWDRFEIWLSCT